MTNYYYKKHKAYKTGILNFNLKGGVPVMYLNINNSRYGKLRGKAALFSKKNTACSPYAKLRYNFSYNSVVSTDGTKLYVCPECGISRTLLRNSGYVIVTRQENADHVVLPAFDDNVKICRFNVVAHDPFNDTLLFLVVRRYYSQHICDELPEEITDSLIDGYLKNHGYHVVHISRTRQICEFVPYVPIYEQLLELDFPGRGYVTEDNVKLIPASSISVETLDVWKHMTDTELLFKLIAGSDWQKYPVTVLAFLYIHERYSRIPEDNCTKYMLSQIGYDYRADTLAELLRDRIIQPDDWNMLQDFLMHDLGVSEDGGYISMTNKNSTALQLCRRAVVVKPYRISVPTVISEIMEKIK